MTVRVLFFGATADIAGTRAINLPVEGELNSDLVLTRMVERFPALGSQKLHLSINQQHAMGDEIIRDGDELAIFTAVSGG